MWVPLKIFEILFALKDGKWAYIKSQQLLGDGVYAEFRAIKKIRQEGWNPPPPPMANKG